MNIIKAFQKPRTTICTKARVNPSNPPKKDGLLKTNVKACSQNLNRTADLSLARC